MQTTKPADSNIFQSIRVYQWIFCIFGSALPPPLYGGRSTKCLVKFTFNAIFVIYSLILIALAVWSSWEHNTVIYEAYVRYDLDCITTLLSFIQNHMVYVILIDNMLHAFGNRLALMEIFQLITKMEFEICEKLTFKWKLLKTTAMGYFITASVLVYVYINVMAGNLSVRAKILLPFFLICTQSKCYEYRVYIQVVYELLQSLIDSLQALAKEIAAYYKLEEKPLPSSYVNQLLKYQLFLNRLWLLINKLEKYFARQIILMFLYNGNMILSTLNWSYVSYIYDVGVQTQICRFGLMFTLLIPLLQLCTLSEKCIQKYSTIGTLIHSIYPHTMDTAIRMRIREFSLQLKHQQLLFTCNGYMDINNKTFGKLLLIYFSYVVILIQFKLEDVSNAAKVATQFIFGHGKKPL